VHSWQCYAFALFCLCVSSVTGPSLSRLVAQEESPLHSGTTAPDLPNPPQPASSNEKAPATTLDEAKEKPKPEKATVTDKPGGDEPALPEFGGFWLTRPKLTGDWFGLRTDLRDHGVTLDVSSTQFYQGLTTGGFPQEIRLFAGALQNQFQYGGRADYLLNIDGQKAGLWQGLAIDLHGETLYGHSVNSNTGALMPVSLGQDVPLPNGTITALTGVTVRQALSENFVLFAGKINTLDDFNQPFTGGGRGVDGFMNAAFLFNPVLALTIPYSTFGAGMVVSKDKEVVFSVSVLDTNNTPTVTGFDTFFDNGMTLVVQANLPTKFFDRKGHQGLTGSYSTGRYSSADLAAVLDPLNGLAQRGSTTGSWSLTYAFDQQLAVAADDPKLSWGVLGNAGLSDGNPNPVRWTANIGLGGSSPLPARDRDTFGVGYFYVGVSDSFKQLAPRLFPLRDEQGVELFYNIGLTPWCHVTPDLQVMVPTSTRAETSLLVGLRAKIDF
jgi:porin